MHRRFLFLSVAVLVLAGGVSLSPSTSHADINIYRLSTNKTGGDCSLIGSWNPDTKTCTLTGDVAGGIDIVADAVHRERTSGIIIDGAGHTLRGEGTGNGIHLYYTNGITIKNIAIDNFATGIYLESAGQAAPLDVYTVIDAVTITNTKTVLLDAYSHRTRITNLTADTAPILLSAYYSLDLSLEHVLATNINGNTENPGSVQGGGVRVLDFTERTRFSDVSISGGTLSFEIRNAQDVSLRSVSLHGVESDYLPIGNTQRGTFFRIDGNKKEHYRHDIDTSNTVNGRTFLYHKDLTGVTINAAGASSVICVSCENVAITGATIEGADRGILLYDTHRSRVENSSISKATAGLTLVGSTENTITRNSFSNNWSHVLLTPSQKEIGWNYGPVYGLDTHSTGNTFSQNNFASGPVSASPILDHVPNSNTYFSPLPEGGNYWNSFDEAGEGCIDANADSFCDAPYAIPNGQGGTIQDAHPRTRPDAWLLPSCTDNCVSNIAFIPGFEGSRLYENNSWLGGEDQLWEPTKPNDVPELALNAEGESIKLNVYTRDVIDTGRLLGTVGLFDVYKNFMASLDMLKDPESGIIADWRALPYDWRFDPRDVVARGVRFENEVRRMETEIEELAETSKTGKVTIVAHSMGGHVAKVLVDALAQSGKAHLVDRIIFVGTPHLGTPKAIPSLLHGYDTRIPGWAGILATSASGRALGITLPSAHNLLPSQTYFQKENKPVVTLTDAPSLLTSSQQNTTITDWQTLRHFLSGDGERSVAEYGDTDRPTILTEHLLNNAESFHSTYDAWVPPIPIEQIHIIGWGLPTVNGIRYSEKKEKNKLNACYGSDLTFTTEGDKTVVWASAAGEGERYFVDLLALQDSSGASDIDKEAEHANILESTPVRSLIKNLITHTATTSPPSVVLREKPSLSSISLMRLSVCSPADIHLYDDEGRHTGRIPSSDGFIHYEEEIPGTTYLELGHTKHIIAPEDSYRTTLSGTGEGTMDVVIRHSLADLQEETVLASYSAVPVTEETSATVEVSPSSPQEPLALDTNGDGTVDETILPDASDPPLSFTDLLQTLTETIDTIATASTTKETLKKQVVRIVFLYQKLLSFRTHRAELKRAHIVRIDERTESRFLSLEAYATKLASLPESKKRRITPAQKEEITNLLSNLEPALALDPDTGLPSEEILARLKETRENIETLSLPESVRTTILNAFIRLETRFEKTLERLGTFDERTKLGEERLQLALPKSLTTLSGQITKYSALPSKNSRRILGEDATRLREIVTNLTNLIPSL